MTLPFWRRRLYWITLFVVAILTLYLFRAPILSSLGGYLDVSESPRKVDYVMVLGGHPETRAFTAAALVKAGVAESVLLVRPKHYMPEEEDRSKKEETVSEEILLSQGIALNKIHVLKNRICVNTEDEALSLGDFLQDHPNATVAVITNPFHTRRARLLFDRHLPQYRENITFFAAPLVHINAKNWWQSEEGFAIYTSEFAKVAIYQFLR